jgi:hypothetical protein
MKTFKQLTEAKETVVFGFGRFNPPTTGHEKLIEKVASVAKGNPFFIYPSHTTGPKDPLPHAKKVAWMRKMFPKYKKNIIADNNAKTAIHIAEKLYRDGYKNLIMVAGSDRLKEFDTLLQRYNDAPDKKGNQLFKFDSVKVVSAGERDPDAEGVEGMSASKMRTAAEKGDFDSFKTGIPATLNDADKKKLYFEVRKNMGIREEREMGEDYDSLRDAYLTGKIWNVGEVVEANGISGEVVRKGTNYLSFVSEDGKVHKAWLHEIELDEKYDSDKFFSGKGTPEQRLQLLKLQNKALRALGGSPKQKAIKKEIDALRKKMGMKVKEEVELDERNYALEYQNYGGKPEQIARRSSRNKARRAMGDKAVKGMDVGHADNDPMNNDPKNLRMEKPSDNRREPRLREKPELDERWYNDVLAKMSQISHSSDWGKIAKEYVAGMKDPEHRKHPSAWAQDVAKQYNGVTGRQLIKYINKLVDDGKLPKELKAELQVESFSDFVKQINEVKQDKDVDDKDGTQPAKYYAGDMAKSTKSKRDAHFKAKKAGPAPGDASAKTKPSTHTKKFKQMFGEALPKNADQGDYIDDFEKSDAPQFKGKSKEKRKDMAIAAYLSKNESFLDNVNKMLSEDGHTDVASMKNKIQIAMSALQKMQSELTKLGDEDDLPTWWTNKVATAVSRIDDMSDYLDTQVEDFTHYPGQVDPKKDKSDGAFVRGDPSEPIEFDGSDTKSILDKANKDVENERGLKQKPFVEAYQLDEKIAGLVKKADKSGMPYSILKKVYDRGMAAYKTGHRPGTTPQQWAMARVNSFTTKSAGTWGKADKDLAKQVEQIEESCTELNEWGEVTEVDAKSGKELNNPTKGDVKKYKVYVKNAKGNVIKVEFGDPNMSIQRDDPKARANFRARHNCDQKKDKTTAGYWSCKFWSTKSVTDLMKG